jgi:lipoprotein-anchoring transpeptidase ErfK/SrfK
MQRMPGLSGQRAWLVGACLGAALAASAHAAPARAAGACPPGIAASTGAAGSKSVRSTAGVQAVKYRPGRIDVGSTKALVAGFVAGGQPVSFIAEYGRGTRYGSCSAWQHGVPAETVAKITLTGLQPGAIYHFRLVAKTAAGAVAGADRTFRTLPGGHIPEGVEIGDVAVGGLTRNDALDRLARPLAAPLRFGYAGAYWTVSRAKAGGRVAAAAAVRSALTAAPDQALPAASVSIDSARLSAYVASLARRFGRPSREPSVKLVGTRAVVKAASPGLEVDTRRMTALIRSALESGSPQRLTLAMKAAPATAPKTPEKAVVVRLGAQTLTAYLNGKPIMTTPVTTGRPALPTPIGSYYIHFRASPYTFISPWPPGSPYYYPPAPVTWAMYFYDNDFLHDDPAEPSGDYGAGSEYGYYASHGCVHVPHDSMAFLYDWLPIGATVIVSQT